MTSLSLIKMHVRKRILVTIGLFALAGLLTPLLYLATAASGLLLPTLAAGTWPTRILGMLEYGSGASLASLLSFGGNVLVYSILGAVASVTRPALVSAVCMFLGAGVLTLPAMIIEGDFLFAEFALATALLLSLWMTAKWLTKVESNAS
jgi:hypothetical protein